MNIASHAQSVAKALTWRATAGVDTLLISWLVTGNMTAAFGIVGTELLTKSLLYYLHERVWHTATDTMSKRAPLVRCVE